MNNRRFPYFFVSLLLISSYVFAEITADGSLGPKATLSGPNMLIPPELGQQRGSNLFHSFGVFNINKGERATFTGPESITNILSRITAGQPSNINGMLSSTIPGANLFLLNPAGFMFGPNAKLDLQGSFHTSTADYIRLQDDSRFNATASSDAVQLTSASPSAFGFLGGDPGSISVNRSDLALKGPETLSLLGGQIDILSGKLAAPGGKINLASGAPHLEISLDTLDIAVDSFQELGDIRVSKNTSINADGNSAGSITIRGGSMAVDDSEIHTHTLGDGKGIGIDIGLDDLSLGPGALISADNKGNGASGNIAIDAKNITLSGSQSKEDTGIRALVEQGARGAGGSIKLTTDNLVIGNGALITATTKGLGNGGRLLVQANNVMLNGEGNEKFTGLSAQAAGGSQGDAGSLMVNTNTLEVRDGAVISTDTFSSGKGGELTLEADRIFVSRQGSKKVTGITSQANPGSRGDGGTLTIKANQLDIHDGGKISSSTFGPGQGGRLSVDAGKINLSADGAITLTGILSLANSGSSGNSGELTVHADQLTIRNGALISNTTEGEGRGGRLSVTADQVLLSGDAAKEFTGISAQAGSNSANRGGDLNLVAKRLEIRDGAVISTGAFGAGKGGQLSIEADEIILSRDGAKNVTGITAQANPRSTADGGDIKINTNSLEISNNAVISARTRSAGQGGDVTLESVNTKLSTGGTISAESHATTANAGNSGSLSVTVKDSLQLTDNALITVETAMADAGDINLQVDSFLHLRDKSQISTSVADGQGDGGNISIKPKVLVLNESDIIAQAREGRGGDIHISADQIVTSVDSTIDASSQKGIDGTLQIIALEEKTIPEQKNLKTAFIDAGAQLTTGCEIRANNQTGKNTLVLRQHGAPLSPEGLLPANELASILHNQPGQLNRIPLLEASLKAFHEGRFDEAIQGWQTVSHHFTEPQDFISRIQSSRQFNKNRQFGVKLNRASYDDIADQRGSTNRALAATIANGIGNTLLAQENLEEAASLFDQAIELAQQGGHTSLVSSILNNRGNYYAMRGAFDKALTDYKNSALSAKESRDILQEAKSHANKVNVLLNSGNPEAAQRGITLVKQGIETIEDSREKAILLINAAKSYQRLATLDIDSMIKAYHTLRQAESLARQFNDNRLLAYALGNIANLYGKENRIEEALFVTRQAIRSADQANAFDALYRLYWQEGKLLRTKGEGNDAIRAYRNAIDVVEKTRQEILFRYGSSELHFRRGIAPIYMDLVDALLEGAKVFDERENPETANQYLVEVRNVVEQLKAAELRNYFRDECIGEIEAKKKSVEKISATAAVVYPIIRPHRLELLVSFPSNSGRTLEHYRVPIANHLLLSEINEFRSMLQSKMPLKKIQQSGQRLYEMLVKPYLNAAKKANVNTVVFVPGGALLNIPMAALYDGKQFLIEQFSIVTTPSLDLIDPKPLAISKSKLLLAGLSESVKGFPPLQNVPGELKAIKSLYGGDVLLNEDFTLKHFNEAIEMGKPSIVHIASHASFSGDPADSFLLVHDHDSDKKLNINRLADYLRIAQFRKKPIELLVLSACQTAQGNERAVLGLVGVGIKAGVRSAIGSLWNVNDPATRLLMVAFYRNLDEKFKLTKAQAMRNAQIKLLRQSRDFSHPHYWAPFQLVNNWL